MVKQQKLTHVGCWDHVRRKFDEAEKAASDQKKNSKSKRKATAPSKARVALSTINKLYVIEREIKALEIEEKYRLRQEKNIPILKELKAWLEKNHSKVVRDSLTWTAINYTLNQWDKQAGAILR